MQRSLLLLENATKSKHTFKTYMYHLKKFKDFYKIKDYDSMLSISPDKLQIMLEDYIMHLKKTVSPNSVPTMYYGMELFFSMNDVNLNTKKLRRMFPAKIKRTGHKPYTTEDVQKMLSVTRYKRDKAFIHFLASTGARIGVIDNLKLKQIEIMPDDSKSVLLYEGTDEEYYAFLTPEASKSLDEYFEERTDDGERLGPESPVFRIIYARGILKPKPLTISGSKNIIYRALGQSKIQRTKIGKSYDIQLDHGFRKRFNTILKLNNDVNSNVAEKLMAHKRGLDGVYLKPTREECFREFKKAIPDLVIDQSMRLQAEIMKKDEALQEKESEKDLLIQHLKDEIKNRQKTEKNVERILRHLDL